MQGATRVGAKLCIFKYGPEYKISTGSLGHERPHWILRESPNICVWGWALSRGPTWGSLHFRLLNEGAENALGLLGRCGKQRPGHLLMASLFLHIPQGPSSRLCGSSVGGTSGLVHFPKIKFAFLTFKLKSIFIFLFGTQLREDEGFPGCTTVI